MIEAQHRAELAEHRLADLKAVLEDMRHDRDHWRVHAGRLALSDARTRQPSPRGGPLFQEPSVRLLSLRKIAALPK